MTRLTRILTLVATLHLGAATPAIPATDAAQPDSWGTPLTAKYDFYIGGLPIAEIELSGLLAPDGYDAKSSVVTRGILELLVKGRVSARSQGVRHDYGHFTPSAYVTSYSTRSERRAVKISYDDQVPADVSIVPPEAPMPYDTNPAQHGGALDPVTAAVTLMTPNDAESLCNRTIPVFDGKRRYDLILLPLERRPAGNSPPEPVWSKPLVRCFGVYERIAGFEPELQVNQRYYPFDVWFENDGGQVFRPVRVAGRTRLGFAIGNLRQ